MTTTTDYDAPRTTLTTDDGMEELQTRRRVRETRRKPIGAHTDA